MLAVAHEENRPQFGLASELVHGFEQALDHRAVIGIVNVGTVESDAGDSARIKTGENGFGHGNSAWQECRGRILGDIATAARFAGRERQLGNGAPGPGSAVFYCCRFAPSGRAVLATLASLTS